MDAYFSSNTRFRGANVNVFLTCLSTCVFPNLFALPTYRDWHAYFQEGFSHTNHHGNQRSLLLQSLKQTTRLIIKIKLANA